MNLTEWAEFFAQGWARPRMSQGATSDGKATLQQASIGTANGSVAGTDLDALAAGLNAGFITERFGPSVLAANLVVSSIIHVAAGNEQLTRFAGRYSNLSTSGNAVLEKLGNGVALGSGVVMTGVMNLAASANNVQVPTLNATVASLQLIAGDAVAVKMAGTMANLEGLSISATFKPLI